MRAILRGLAVGAMTGAVLVGTAGAANAADDPPPPDGQGPIEETYDYPNAARWESERPGLKLKKGDGHILIVDCADPLKADVFVVESRLFFLPKGYFCFQVKGHEGFLSLEIPKTYFVRGDATHKVTVTVQDGMAEPKSYTPTALEWTYVEAADENATRALELRVTS